MKIFLRSLGIFLWSTPFFVALAWEPPAEVTKEKVRMCTLIVVGTVDLVEITDKDFTTTRRDLVGLKDDEVIHLHIKVDHVLYPKGDFYTSTDAMLRASHLDVRDIRKNWFGNRSCIFYLTKPNDGSRLYYPFYQYTLLCGSVSEEAEVTSPLMPSNDTERL